jgi:hypothetical protein
LRLSELTQCAKRRLPDDPLLLNSVRKTILRFTV